MQTAPVTRHTGSGGGNKKGTSAERRASHNAIERARRESLNGRFLQLAATLPAISDVQRPSKSLIVNKSLDFVKDALNRETMYRLKIDNMHQESMRLREQLNSFLAQAGMDLVPMPTMDELPPPMADVGARKRMNHMSMSLPDAYDYDDEDSTFAAGSEGEAGKQSPTSSSSAGSVRGSLSNAASVNAFTPISYNNPHYGMATGAITTRPDYDAAKWMPSHFDANSAPATAASHPSSYTYANLIFSSPGMAPSGSVTQGSTAGLEHYMGMPGAATQQQPPSHQLAGNYAALRNMQQQQQQPQMHLTSQQQQQQAAAMNQFNYDALNQPQHFFDQAALQSTSFLTAV